MIMFFLTYFILFLQLYSTNSIIFLQQQLEIKKNSSIQQFSIIESDVIHQVVNKFDDYDLIEFKLTYPLGDVLIQMIDEKAYIHYQFEEAIYAILYYDLVFDSAIDYEIVDWEEYSTFDKLED